MNFIINGINLEFDDVDVDSANFLKEFYQLALKIRKNYLERYDNLRDIASVVKDFPTEFKRIVTKVAEFVVGKFHEAEVWSVTTQTFTEQFLEECDAFTTEAEEVYMKYQAIIGQRELADVKRQIRKDSRGKLVGGGFGLGGAMKGMLIAGSVNAATGMIHSMFGMFDKAAANSKFNRAFNELYRDSKVKYKLANALYSDVVTAFNVCVQYMKENGADTKLIRYTFENIRQMENIRENLKKSMIPENSIAKAFVDMLIAFPAWEETYEIIYQRYGDSDGDLIELAEYFEINIDLREIAESDELLEDYFGDDLADVCKRLQYNPYFNALKSNIDDLIEDLITDCIEYATEHNVNKTFLRSVFEFSDYKNSSIAAKLPSIFPASNGEIPLLFFDTSITTNASAGVLLTDMAVHSSKGEGKVFPIDSIEEITSNFSEIKINGVPIAESYKKDEQEQLLNFLVTVMQYRDMDEDYETDEESESEEGEKNDEPVSRKDLDKNIEQRFFADIMKDSGFGEYFFSYSCFHKLNKSAINNAYATYAAFPDTEILAAFYDNTMLRSGKEGFVFTNKSLYFCNKFGQGQIAIQEIDTFEYKTIKLLPNIIVNDKFTIPCRFLNHDTVQALCTLFPKIKEYLRLY